MTKPTQLYRHFGAADDLLYVGISLSAVHRLSQHCAASPWAHEIVRVSVELFPTREAAMEAERLAVESENPRHNVRLRSKKKLEPSPVLHPKAETSRAALTRSVVFKPLYNILEASEALGISTQAVKNLCDAGKLGFIVLHKGEARQRRAITGWQIIDFLEYAASESEAA
jgi:hypothetical protein